MSKRADLQGIRAFAVAMVIAYHLDPTLLSGGFIGVDVFFVLSGFLITQVIFSELDRSGSINLLAFWTRRIKRLLPNALLTLTAVLLASWLLLPAYRWPTIASDVGAAAVFLSNFHFARNAVDYFRLDDPESPVLHFWSLSIEEQFYIVLPVVLLLLAPLLRRKLLAAVGGLLILIVAVSFAASLWIMETDQTAAFFYTQSRVWQLALGGLLGINFAARLNIAPDLRGSLAWVGAALIAFAAFRFENTMAYPGLYALVPTLGAAALILGLDSGKLASPLRSLLSLPTLGWIGDRSYSLYLWHWPVIIFTQTRMPLDAYGMAFALMVMLVISSVAYSFVERPIHHGETYPWRRFAVPAYAGLAIAVVCLLAVLLPRMPQPEQSLERTAAIETARKDLGANYKDGCHLEVDQTENQPCIYGSAGAARKVVLFGDSHAAQWLTPLASAAKSQDWELRAWTKTTCPWPEVDIWMPSRKAFYPNCNSWRENTLADIVALKPYLVVLGALSDYRGYLYDGGRLSGEAYRRTWETAMLATIDRLQAAGIAVVVIEDNPSLYKSYRDCLALGRGDCGRERKAATASAVEVADFLKTTRPALRIVSLNDQICDDARCPAIRGGQILYRDSNHITATYAGTFAPIFDELLAATNPGTSATAPTQ